MPVWLGRCLVGGEEVEVEEEEEGRDAGTARRWGISLGNAMPQSPMQERCPEECQMETRKEVRKDRRDRRMSTNRTG